MMFNLNIHELYDIIEALEELQEELGLKHREAVLLQKMKKKVNWLKCN